MSIYNDSSFTFTKINPLALKARLNKFQQTTSVRKKSAGLGIRGKLFFEISDTFVKAALAGKIPRITAKELYNSFNPDEGTGTNRYPQSVFTLILI